MTRDVAREGRCHERRELIRHPVDREDPAHAGVLRGRILQVPLPGADRDLADVIGERLMPLARGARCSRDDLDQSGNQRESVRIVRGKVGVAGLAQAAHVRIIEIGRAES